MKTFEPPTGQPPHTLSAQILLLSDGRQLAYHRCGQRGGRPVFFLHGWPGAGVQGYLAAAEARRLGIDLVCPDRPGMGRSDYQQDRRLADWPATLEELAAALGWERFGVFAVSGGGPYALAAAAGLEQVTRVVISCGAPLPETVRDPDRSFFVYRLLARFHDRFPGLLTPMMHLARAYVLGFPTGVGLAPFVALLGKTDRQALQGQARRVLGASLREAFRQHPRGLIRDATRYAGDWEIDFEAVRCPVDFFHGDADRNVPLVAARETLKRLPQASLMVVPGEGHYSLPIDHLGPMLEKFCQA